MYEIYEIDLDTKEETIRRQDIKYLVDASQLREAFASRYKNTRKRFYFREQRE